MATLRRHTIWADHNGVKTLCVLSGNATLAGVVDALLAASVGGIAYNIESELLDPTAEGGSGPYSTVQDKVYLVFTDSMGSTVTVTLPCPNAAIFMADNKTVDPTNALVSAIILACIGTVLSAAGNPVNLYLTGYRGPTANKEYTSPE